VRARSAAARLSGFAVVCALLAGCTKKELIGSQLAGPTSRSADLEASLQILDEHPEYLADVYAAARRHPRTLQAIVDMATADLGDPDLAKMVSARLALHPEVIDTVAREAIDATSKTPAARAAIDKAVGQRAATAVGMLADEPAVLAAVTKEAIAVLEKRPAARQAVMGALRDLAPELVAMVMKDPASMKAFVAAVVHEATSSRASIREMLQALGGP
jgi:hypothetical protein